MLKKLRSRKECKASCDKIHGITLKQDTCIVLRQERIVELLNHDRNYEKDVAIFTVGENDHKIVKR